MIEQAAIKALQERHNYTVLNCMTEEPDTLPDGTGRKDKKQVVLPDVMFESLCRISRNKLFARWWTSCATLLFLEI
mgnify:CR=1 FL=1